MLNEFWIGLKLQGIAHNRGLESIYRIAVAHAKLRLKQTVDSEIAGAAMESFILLLSNRGKVAQIVDYPRDIVINNIINEIENCQCAITFQEVARLACIRDVRVKQYFGKKKLSVEDNKKYRDIRQKFVENRFDNISIVSIKPLTLTWHASSVPVTLAKNMCTTDPIDSTDQVSLSKIKFLIIRSTFTWVR